MEMPYYFLGIAYLVILGCYLVMAFFNVYHLIKYGFFDFTGKINGILFLGAWLIIMVFTIFFLKDVPWLEYFDILGGITDGTELY